jgi:hypothetical protein
MNDRSLRLAQVLSGKVAVRQDPMELPIASLVMTKDELFQAAENIARGYPAMTEGPLEVAYLPKSRRYQLTNGYHRMVEYLLSGKISVPVRVTKGEWRLPSSKDRFKFQPGLQYKGFEDFMEPYLLRRL